MGRGAQTETESGPGRPGGPHGRVRGTATTPPTHNNNKNAIQNVPRHEWTHVRCVRAVCTVRCGASAGWGSAAAAPRPSGAVVAAVVAVSVAVVAGAATGAAAPSRRRPSPRRPLRRRWRRWRRRRSRGPAAARGNADQRVLVAACTRRARSGRCHGAAHRERRASAASSHARKRAAKCALALRRSPSAARRAAVASVSAARPSSGVSAAGRSGGARAVLAQDDVLCPWCYYDIRSHSDDACILNRT